MKLKHTTILEAVSYTHLDVYKRQSNDRPLCGSMLQMTVYYRYFIKER